MKLSVVIPTRDRQHTLEKALNAYLTQTALSGSFEILVIDDGSSDGTAQLVAAFRESSNSLDVRYFRQARRGPAAARNLGIRQAAGDVVLFSDDDVIPGRSLVSEHLAWHQKHPESSIAVLGYVTWAPELEPTPFMKWYGERGPLFAYGEFAGRTELDFRFFYSCNVSLKVEFLRTNGMFDEEFTSAAFEDTELGYRLTQRGMRILYNPAAIGYHYQRFSFADACRRAQRTAAARMIFDRKEAGISLRESEARKVGGGKLLGKRIAVKLVPAFAPLRYLIDSRVNLPPFVYRSFLWYYAREAEVASGHGGQGQGG